MPMWASHSPSQRTTKLPATLSTSRAQKLSSNLAMSILFQEVCILISPSLHLLTIYSWITDNLVTASEDFFKYALPILAAPSMNYIISNSQLNIPYLILCFYKMDQWAFLLVSIFTRFLSTFRTWFRLLMRESTDTFDTYWRLPLSALGTRIRSVPPVLLSWIPSISTWTPLPE